jgi:hypothetical protein
LAWAREVSWVDVERAGRGETTDPESRWPSDTRTRRIVGSLFVIAAIVIIMIGYRSVPDANTCYLINLTYREAGRPPICSAVPSIGYFVTAGLCLVTGLLMLTPRWLRWPTASREGPTA